MEVTRTFDIIHNQLASFPREDAVAEKKGGQWKRYSTAYLCNMVNRVSTALLEAGIQKGDKVAIVSWNRPEWNYIDLGLAQIGAVSVPMYPTITEEDYRYILQDAQVKIVFAADHELWLKIHNASQGLDFVQATYTFDQIKEAPHWLTFLANVPEQIDNDSLNEHRAQVDAEDLMTLIYTSGTTGRPKGVMLSHRNVVSNAIAVATSDIYPHDPTQAKALSFLPICHIFERTGVFFYFYTGIGVYYAESIDTIADNIREVKPNVFATVPRLLEKVYDRIVSKGGELTGIKRKLFFWALKVGHEYELPLKKGLGYKIQLALARKLIFKKWKEALGGNLDAVVSGGAALQPRLSRVFWGAGIPILEAYGLTETSPGISFTRSSNDMARIGCVGPALKGIEIKIAEDGEVLAKGPNIMMGYYNNPEETAKVLTDDGWFHTGDIGEMVEGRFLRITDRKKEMFKTSGGKYIAPQLMENTLKSSLFVEQCMVVGEGHKFPGALIVPNFEALREWCRRHDIAYSDDASMIKNEAIVKRMAREVEQCNTQFAQWEKIKQYQLLAEPWTIDGGELTAKLSLRRKQILNKYAEQVNAIYG